MAQKKDAVTKWEPTTGDYVSMSIETLLFLGQVVLCFLFFNYYRLSWLMGIGWAVLAVAMVFGWRGRTAIEDRGGIEQGEKWLHSRVVVDTGIYGVTRHPIYCSFFLISLALVFICQHWAAVATGVLLMVLIYRDMLREEKFNLEKFGADYRSYMERVPRMNIVAGLFRKNRTD